MRFLLGIAILIVASFIVVKDKKSAIKITVITESTNDSDVTRAKEIYDSFVILFQDDIYKLENINDIRKYLIDNKDTYYNQIINEYSDLSISFYCNNALYNEYTYMDKKCDLNEIIIKVGEGNGYTMTTNIRVSEVIKSSEQIDIIKPILSR